MMNSTQRFSNRVENYVKYRPHYPKRIIDYLKTEIGFAENEIVADIGSGTGILTELFIKNNNKVYAIEPNAAMRLKAEELFENDSNFISVNATAEQTSLKENSIDLIVAGQAFHWFNSEKTKREFIRIAKQEAHAALIWNDRLFQSPFEKDYEDLLIKFASDYNEVNHRRITPEKIETFFYPEMVAIALFKNDQFFDFEGLKGRLFSSSYISLEKNEKYFEMLERLQYLFNKYENNGIVHFVYETKLYLSKIK